MSELSALREVLGKFVTGVTVVTVAGPTGPVGITVNSFTSVSLDPALVLFCLHRSSRVLAAFQVCRSFAINILAHHQESVSRQFSGPIDARTSDIAFRSGVTGAPLLADALAYLECQLHQRIDAGDHVIVVGEVQDFAVRSAGIPPLTFYSGRYTSVTGPISSPPTDTGTVLGVPGEAGSTPRALTGAGRNRVRHHDSNGG